MTAQISDEVRIEGRRYSVAAVRGSGLFEPATLGLRAVASSSACWRGFSCTYTVRARLTSPCKALQPEQVLQQPGLVPVGVVQAKPLRTDPFHLDEIHTGDRWLELTELHIRLAPPQRTTILGVEPKTVSSRGDLEYADMHAPIAFSGGLLIGDDWIAGMSSHMGFPPAHGYRVVLELIFEAGRLARMIDQSELAAKIRVSLRGKTVAPGALASDLEVADWVESTFSLKYW